MHRSSHDPTADAAHDAARAPASPVDPCDPSRYPPAMLVDSVDALNAHAEWFAPPDRPAEPGPFVVVVDGFYDDPLAVRRLALQQSFIQYLPPLAEQVGAERAAEFGYPPAWFASALLRFRGIDVLDPQPGFRHADDAVRLRIERAVGESVRIDTWHQLGDGWNGAFHIQLDAWRGDRGSVHHHDKPGDVWPHGWSGLVYLSPDAPPSAGTSIWRDRRTGLCVGSPGISFDRTPGLPDFQLALLVPNRFNRLVLFRQNVLHRAEHGFGSTPESARLTQTFFFLTDPPARG